MQFQQLNAFKAVFELGTVTAAADFIHITQPAVSRLIGSLERKVGFKLFQRVKGRLIPTDKGYAFYLEVAKAYNAIESLEQSAIDIGQKEQGSLHISAFPMLSACFLPQVLAQMIVDTDNLASSLKTYRSEEVLRRTALQSCDIGFALLPEITAGVTSIEVTCDSVCILPPHSPLASLDIITPTDLSAQPLICCEQDVTQQSIEQVFKHHGAKFNAVAEVSLASAIASLVSFGAGSAIVDPFSARAAISAGQNITVRPFEPKIEFKFFILFPTLKVRSEIANKFVTLFFELAAREGIHLNSTTNNQTL